MQNTYTVAIAPNTCREQIINFKVLMNVFDVLNKRIKIEVLYWKIGKSDEFNFLKVKLSLNPNVNTLLIISSTSTHLLW